MCAQLEFGPERLRGKIDVLTKGNLKFKREMARSKENTRAMIAAMRLAAIESRRLAWVAGETLANWWD